jgi:hypothetical protein
MPEPPDKRDAAPPRPQWPSQPAAKPADKGKVIHDARGNAKWDLGIDTTRVKKLTTSQLIKKLDIADLALLDEHASSPHAKPKPGGGFEPYEPAAGKPPPKGRR